MRSQRELKEVKVKTVEKTLSLLELLAEQNIPLSLTRISQLSNMSISTVYRLLNTLTRSGFIERDRLTGYYQLGLKAFLIGNAALQKVELRNVVLPFMNTLSRNSQESVYLAIFSQQNVFYTDCVKTSTPVQLSIQTGMPFPACQTSSGKVFVAYLTLEEQLDLIDFYVRNEFIKDTQGFLKELAQIQRNGYSAGVSHFGGLVREFSVPIFNHSKACVAAISIFGSVVQAELTDAEKELLNQLKSTGAEISKALGYF